MNNKNKFLLKNIGVFTIGSFGSKILSFLLVPLYTTVLSTTEYGTVDLITSTAALLMPILLLSIFDATLRFGMDSNYKKEDVISTSVHIAIIGSLILVGGVGLIKVLHIFDIPNSYLIFLCFYFVMGAFNQIMNLYLRAKNQATVIAVSGILNTLVACISNVVLLLVFKWGITGYMISNIIGVLIQNIYQLIIGKIYIDIKFWNYTDLSKQMVGYSAPLISNSISWWVNNASDRYILTFFRGIAENGIYSVSYKIPTILSMFQSIFYNAWSISAIAEFDEDDSDGFIGSNYEMYSYISLLVCSFLLIINKPLAAFLYKKSYFEAWKCVPFLLTGTVFSGISQFEGSLFAATKNTKSVAKTTIIGAMVNTIGNCVFIYFIGNVGAALATLLGYLITWLLRTIKMTAFVKMKVDWFKHILSIIIVLVQSIMATIGLSLFLQIFFGVMLIIVNKEFFFRITRKIFK